MERNMNDSPEEMVIEKMGERKVKRGSVWERIKKDLLVVFCLILEETKTNEYFACCLMFVSFAQIWGLAFDTDIFPIISHTLHTDIEAVLNMLRIYKTVKGTDSVPFNLIVAYLLLSFQVLYLILLYMIWHHNCRKQSWWGTGACSVLTQLNLWIFLMPTTEFYISLLRCDGIFGDCLSFSYNIHIGIQSLLYLFLILNIVVICLLGNDCALFCHNNPFCRYPWQFESFYCFTRVVLSVSSQFCIGSEANWLVIGEMMIISLIMVYFMVVYLPYYNSKVSACFCFCVIGLCWVTCNMFTLKLLLDLDLSYRGHTAVMLCGLGICFHWSLHFKENQIDRIFKLQRPSKLVSEIDFHLYIVKFIRLIERKISYSISQEDDINFHGLLALHKSECLHPKCPLNNPQDYYIPLNRQYSNKENRSITDIVCLKHLICRMFETRIIDSESKEMLVSSKSIQSKSVGNYLACAYFFIYGIGNYHLASLKLDQAEKRNHSPWIEAAVARGKRIIEQAQIERNREKIINELGEKKEGLNLQIVFEYEAFLAQLKKKLARIAEEQMKLCSELLLSLPNLNKIQEYGMNIIEMCEEAKSEWESLKQMNCNNPQTEIIYGIFLDFVMNRRAESADHIKLGNLINEEAISNSLFNEETSVIVLGASPELCHKIIKASSSISKFFEYTAVDLQGRNIEILMPMFIGKEHPRFINNYLKTGQSHVLNKTVEEFIVDKESYISKISLYTRQYYDLFYEACFLGLIKHTGSKESIIITNNKGKILGISREVYREMHEITPVSLHENEIYLSYLCPSYKNSALFKNFWDFEGNLMLKILAPRNLFSLANTITDEHLINTKEGNALATLKTMQCNKYLSSFLYNEKEPSKKWCNFRNYCSFDRSLELKIITFQSDRHFDADSGSSILSKNAEHFIELEMRKKENAALRAPSRKIDLSHLRQRTSIFIPKTDSIHEDFSPTQSMETTKQKLIQYQGNNVKLQKTKSINELPVNKYVKMIKGSSFESFYPFPIQIAHWVATFIFLMTLSTYIALFLLHYNSYSNIIFQREIQQWNREESTLKIYGASRALSLMTTEEDSEPILNLTFWSNYDYGSLEEDSVSLDYKSWVLRVLHTEIKELEYKACKMDFASMDYSTSIAELIVPSNSIFNFSGFSSQDTIVNLVTDSALAIYINEAMLLYQKALLNSTDYSSETNLIGTNCFPIISKSLSTAFTAIEQGSQNDFNQELNIIYTLTGTVSGSALLCLALFIPFLFILRRDNASIFRLLLNIRQKVLRTQLESAHKFALLLNYETNVHDEFEEEEEEGLFNESEDPKLQDQKNKKNKINKSRYFLTLQGGIWFRTFKLLIVFLILISHLLCYCFIPAAFFNTINYHTNEENLLNKLINSNLQLYSLTIELLRSNGTTTILNVPITDYLNTLSSNLRERLDLMIENHRSYSEYFSSDYISKFDTIVLDNICEIFDGGNSTECTTIVFGVVKYGMFYCNNLFVTIGNYTRESFELYSPAERTLTALRSILNTEEIKNFELLCYKFINPAYSKLLVHLKESIQKTIDNEFPLTCTLFVFFNMFLLLAYFVLWYLHRVELRREMFSAKLFLAYLPIDLISSTPKICNYLKSNASNLLNQQQIFKGFSKQNI